MTFINVTTMGSHMNCYKIQDIVTGEFSTGGMNPRWRKTGKIWKTEADLKKHLHQMEFRIGCYDNCDIVEYKMVEIDTTDIKDYK